MAVIDGPPVLEKTLRHLNLWFGPAHFAPARPPPSGDSPKREPEPETDLPVDPAPSPNYEDVITD